MKKINFLAITLLLILPVLWFCDLTALTNVAADSTGPVVSAVNKLSPKDLELKTIEIADTPENKSRGLMLRPTLCKECAMLFVYDRPSHDSFWMKNTFVSLDMIFLDNTGKVITIHENTKPLDTKIKYAPTAPYNYVLEVNSGFAKKYKISLDSYINIDELKLLSH
ncbi:MAG: DUF192 domain-containing protein [Gammaproteobacteria bacterium]|nr:DUF192 domain-containing protein [Gammaproteobacteria bacterium]